MNLLSYYLSKLIYYLKQEYLVFLTSLIINVVALLLLSIKIDKLLKSKQRLNFERVLIVVALIDNRSLITWRVLIKVMQDIRYLIDKSRLSYTILNARYLISKDNLISVTLTNCCLNCRKNLLIVYNLIAKKLREKKRQQRLTSRILNNKYILICRKNCNRS